MDPTFNKRESLEFCIKVLMEEFTEKLKLRSELYNRLDIVKQKHEIDFNTEKVVKQSYYKTRCDRIDQLNEMIEFYKDKQKQKMVLLQTLFQNVLIIWEKVNSSELNENNIKNIPVPSKGNYNEV